MRPRSRLTCGASRRTGHQRKPGAPQAEPPGGGKPHKRQLKKLEEEPYTIEESRRAVGLGVDKGEYGKRKEKEAAEAAAAAAAAAAAPMEA